MLVFPGEVRSITPPDALVLTGRDIRVGLKQQGRGHSPGAFIDSRSQDHDRSGLHLAQLGGGGLLFFFFFFNYYYLLLNSVHLDRSSIESKTFSI